jgi:hypothetical protein
LKPLSLVGRCCSERRRSSVGGRIPVT